MNRLHDVLQDQQGNYVLPFFWMHGAPEAETRRLMQAVYEAGIYAVCLESRPHPDYAGEQWWRDVDIVLDEAQKRGMKVWILDDAHFPTGIANGKVADKPRHLKRISMVEKHYTVKGPVKGAKVDVAKHLQTEEKHQEQLEYVLLARMQEKNGALCVESVSNVTDAVENGWLYLDLDDHTYRVYVLTTKLGTAQVLNDAVSLVNKDSVRILIDEVYEKHYQHYAEHFGKTICGFFSDEPGFFNLADRSYGYAARTGEESVPLPWIGEIFERLNAAYDGKADLMLPLLFGEQSVKEGEEKLFRAKYMDIVTDLYKTCFADQIGDWCRAHKVEYIGHVVEDEPFGYERLGMSTGHFFRAIRGQDLAGIDVVLGDLLPDRDDTPRGTFYQYGLAQLANSLANQEPKQKGRSICEIFGAFGWSEGVTLMKWMADHMLTGGINHYVPHAFTDHPFPDPDCPPHFWAKGNNPQYPYMHKLFTYMNRVSHLICGGTPIVPSAVLFEAENDWLGETEVFYSLGKELMRQQTPYHLVCFDDLAACSVKDGRLCVGSMVYEHLFISIAQHMHVHHAQLLCDLHAQGAKIYFVDEKPVQADGSPLNMLAQLPVIDRKEMKRIAKAADALTITADGAESRLLRRYSYRQPEFTLHMLQNTSARGSLDVSIRFAQPHVSRLDAMEGKLYTAQKETCFTLAPQECLIYIESAAALAHEEEETVYAEAAGYTGGYRITRAAFDDKETWLDCGETTELYDIERKYPGFAGVVRYDIAVQGNYAALKLEGAQDAFEVFCDGIALGKKIAPPYVWTLPEGETHSIRIEHATTLVGAVPDELSCKDTIAPTGFVGRVMLLK